MKPGDVIKFFKTPGYVQYAIFIGEIEPVAGENSENSVIHWWKDVGMLEPSVLITTFQRLADNSNHNINIVNIDEVGIDFTQVVPRAVAFKTRLEALRKDGTNFNGLFDDSYHFVNWCRNGLGSIDITEQNIMNMRDPRRFVHGSVTNTTPREDTLTVLNNLTPGDMIRFFHQDYEHWAMSVVNEAGVSSVIHLWDRDSVEQPRIVIHEVLQIVGYCKAEIVRYNRRNANGQHAADRAVRFNTIVADFPTIAEMFFGSMQFAFWCCYGLGSNEIPAETTEDNMRRFVTDSMANNVPDAIRRDHNNAMKEMLLPGDLITFSRGSQKHFGLYTKEQDIANVMYWMENGPPTIMVVPYNVFAENGMVVIQYDRIDLQGAIDQNEMVNKANALRTKIRNTEDDCNGLFANSKHFAIWIFDNYGVINASLTPGMIAEVQDVWQHIYKFKPSNKFPEEKVRMRHQNKKVLNALQEGDLVKFHRKRNRVFKYKHYAVYIANDEDTGAPSVIHWYTDPNAPMNRNNPKLCIRIDSFWTVAQYDVSKNGYNKMYESSDINGREVVERAKRLKREFEQGTAQRPRYQLLWNNCEHFANECRYRRHYSRQTRFFRIFDPCCNRPQQ